MEINVDDHCFFLAVQKLICCPLMYRKDDHPKQKDVWKSASSSLHYTWGKFATAELAQVKNADLETIFKWYCENIGLSCMPHIFVSNIIFFFLLFCFDLRLGWPSVWCSSCSFKTSISSSLSQNSSTTRTVTDLWKDHLWKWSTDLHDHKENKIPFVILWSGASLKEAPYLLQGRTCGHPDQCLRDPWPSAALVMTLK